MQGISEKGICFVIAPIGDEGSEIRRRSDQVLKHIITPAAYQCGYKTVRADTISEPGMITSQVIQHLVEDPLVIADLTGRNPNVFYELAVRHAVRKPCVQIIQMGEPIPFDVSQSRTIPVDHHDLDSVARCIEELVKQITVVEKDTTEIDTPITVAIDLQALRQSDNPLEKSSAEIISMLQELVRKVDNLSIIGRPSMPIAYFNELFSYLHRIYHIFEILRIKSEHQKELNEVILMLDGLEKVLRGLFMESGYSFEMLPKYKEKDFIKKKDVIRGVISD